MFVETPVRIEVAASPQHGGVDAIQLPATGGERLESAGRRVEGGTTEEPGEGQNALVLPSLMDATRSTSCVSDSLCRKKTDPRGAGAQAGPGLALAQARFRIRPHGPAAQGARRAWRPEDGQVGAPVLPAGRRRTAPEDPRGAPDRAFLSPISGHNLADIGPLIVVTSMEPTGFEPVTSCLQSRRSPS